jgi:transcriptional regulator with XRE-family HTH domain
MPDLGKRLKTWRAELGLSQDAFAQVTGIPLQTIKGYELSHRLPGAEALTAIARTGVNLNWLLSGDGSMQNPDVPSETREPSAATVSYSQDHSTTVLVSEGRKLGVVVKSPGAVPSAEERLVMRLKAMAGLLGNMPEKEAESLLDEFTSRAQTQQQLSELRQAVQQLRTAQDKRA